MNIIQFRPLATTCRRAALLTCALLLPAFGAKAFDLNTAMMKPSKAYSATQNMTSGRNTFTTEVFREGEKMRMDMNEQDQSMSIIIRMDEDTNYMLMHDMSMFQEVKGKRVEQYQRNMGVEFTNQQELGKETLNGLATTKYSADYKDNNGNDGTGIYWVTDDEIVVKGEMTLQRRRKTTETTWELVNLKVADQPDELFEVPAGYNSLGLGGLFSNARQQSQQNNQPKSDQELAEEGSYEPGNNEPVEQEDNGKNVRKALGKLFRRGN